MEYLLKLVFSVLLSLTGNLTADPGHGHYNLSSPAHQHIITVEHNDNILGNLLNNINGAINQLMAKDNPGVGGLAASKSIFVFMIMLSVFMFIYNLIVGGTDKRMIHIIPLFCTITLFWFVLYAYDGVNIREIAPRAVQYDFQGNRIAGVPQGVPSCASLPGSTPLSEPDNSQLVGFMRLSHDIVTWTSSVLDTETRVYAIEKHNRTNCWIEISPSSMIKNPWALIAVQSNIADQFTAMADQIESAWDIRSDNSGGILPSGSYFILLGKAAVLFVLVWLTKAVMFICFAAISLVIFLNIVFLKVVGMVSMFIIPLVLFEPLKNFAQGGLTAIMSFAIKFLTYVVLISFLLAFITNIQGYVDSEIQKEVGRVTTVPDDQTTLGKRRTCMNNWRAGEKNNPNGVHTVRNNQPVSAREQQAMVAVETIALPSLDPNSPPPPTIIERQSITDAAATAGRDRGEAGILNDRILAYCLTDAPGVNKSIGFGFFLKIMFVIIVYTLLLLLLPGKVVQIFDRGGVAFGDGAVAGMTAKALQASALIGAGAAISMAKTGGAIAGAVAGGGAQSLGAYQAGKTIGGIDAKVKEGGEKTAEDSAKYAQARQTAGGSAGSVTGNIVDRLEKSGSAPARGVGNVIKGVSALAGKGGLSAKAAAQDLTVASALQTGAVEAGPESPAALAHKGIVDRLANTDKVGLKVPKEEWATMSESQKTAFLKHQQEGEEIQRAAAARRLGEKTGEKAVSGIAETLRTPKTGQVETDPGVEYLNKMKEKWAGKDPVAQEIGKGEAIKTGEEKT